MTVREYYQTCNVEGSAIIIADRAGNSMLRAVAHEKGISVVPMGMTAKDVGYVDDSDKEVVDITEQWAIADEEIAYRVADQYR